MHYGCAIAYIAVAAASLSQAIHQTEGGLGLTAVPTPREEASRPFQWDSHRRLSARSLVALDLIRRCLEKFGTAGQPLWSLVASSLYGAFLDGRLSGVRFSSSLTTRACLAGAIWATHEDRGHVIVGGFRVALDLFGEAHLDLGRRPSNTDGGRSRPVILGGAPGPGGSAAHRGSAGGAWLGCSRCPAPEATRTTRR
jgi:hypothetical protein